MSTAEHSARYRARKKASKVFISLDGEGDNGEEKGERQNYILLGASTGERLRGESLGTREIFEWLSALRREHGSQYYVMYGMSYDVEMWLRDLPRAALDALMNSSHVTLGQYWKVSYFPGKIFELLDLAAKHKITIYDMRGWWSAAPAVTVASTKGKTRTMGGFLAALDKELGTGYPDRQLIIDGKIDRGTFTYADLDDVDKYMTAELDRLVDIANSIRGKLTTLGWNLRQWHGSGALANYLLKTHGIGKWRPVPGDEHYQTLWPAAVGAYYGGWIDLGYIGWTDHVVYQIDINSAYPWAMTFLPEMSGGIWHPWTGGPPRDHALYYISWCIEPRLMFDRAPHPFSFRRRDGGVIRPPAGEGWVHGIEVITVQASGRYHIEILEGMEFLPANPDARPFHWVADLYQQRLALKAVHDPAEMVLKTGYASLYGKEAQQVGQAAYQNFFHAGEVTARTRAAMWQTAMQNPRAWVSSMTDSLYSFEPYNVPQGDALGEWKDEGNLVESVWAQAGVMFGMKEDGRWGKTRVRGFGSKLEREEVLAHMHDLQDGNRPVSSFQTFVGMRQARAWNDWDRWRRWYTLERQLDLREDQGKRYHRSHLCRACRDGLAMDVSLHDMFATPAPKDQVASYIRLDPEERDKWLEEPEVTSED